MHGGISGVGENLAVAIPISGVDRCHLSIFRMLMVVHDYRDRLWSESSANIAWGPSVIAMPLRRDISRTSGLPQFLGK